MSASLQFQLPRSTVDSYTVLCRNGVTYIQGSAPMSHVAALMGTAGEGAYMSTRVAKLGLATMAWGSREALDAEEARMVEEAKRRTAGDPPIKQWLAYGERGQSSDAMAHMLWASRPAGHIVSHDTTAHPHDPDDLRRCLLLLDMVPDLKHRLAVMGGVSPVWAALVREWDELTEAFISEAGPEWRTDPKDAPKTYELMRAVIEGAKA